MSELYISLLPMSTAMSETYLLQQGRPPRKECQHSGKQGNHNPLDDRFEQKGGVFGHETVGKVLLRLAR